MFELFNTIFKYKEKKSPDILGYFPERVHVQSMPERRYLWTSRILVIMACLSISLNMILASTIYLLLPQRTVSPKLFYINKYFSQLEQVQPAEVDMPVSDLVTEQHINEYILLRYIITNDYDELRERWAPGSIIFWYSSKQVYSDFAENDVEYSIMQFREKSLIRNVDIEWTRPLARNVWQVQFQTLDYLPGFEKPVVNIWRATLRIGYTRIDFSNKEDAIINPFGFIVKTFSLAYHGTPETSDHYLQEAKRLAEEAVIR